MTSFNCTCKMPSMIKKWQWLTFICCWVIFLGPGPLPGVLEFCPFFLYQALWFMPLLEKNVNNITIKIMYDVTHNCIYNSQANITTWELRSCCQTTNCHKCFDSLEPWLPVAATLFGCQRHGSWLSSCNEYTLHFQISYLWF
jgi:hypothetical protein